MQAYGHISFPSVSDLIKFSFSTAFTPSTLFLLRIKASPHPAFPPGITPRVCSLCKSCGPSFAQSSALALVSSLQPEDHPVTPPNLLLSESPMIPMKLNAVFRATCGFGCRLLLLGILSIQCLGHHSLSPPLTSRPLLLSLIYGFLLSSPTFSYWRTYSLVFGSLLCVFQILGNPPQTS